MLQQGSSDNIPSTASQGVVLVAFGKPAYYGAAYNLAYSIKRYNKNIEIAIILEDSSTAMSHVAELSDVTDILMTIKAEHLYTDGKLDPGKAKIFLYEYLPFERNLYLDVDGIVLKDIKPMLDTLAASGKQYAAHIMGYHKLEQGNKIESMVWAYANDIWAQYNLSESTVLPAINSSWQYIEISPKAHALYKIAQDFYVNNPIPLNKLRNKWGNTQPDELYMNIALAKLEIDPAMPVEFIHIPTKRGLNYAEVINNYYIQAYYGGQGFTPIFYVDWLDRMMRKWMSEEGRIHKYLINRIISNKHADAKR